MCYSTNPLTHRQQSDCHILQFDRTLGSIKGTSIRAPKPLIELPTAPAELHGGADGDQSRELKERSRRRKALIVIEKGFRLLLQAEDRGVKLEQPDMSGRARQQIQAERDVYLEQALGFIEVAPLDKQWVAEDDQQFWRLTTVEKGRKFFARLLMQVSVCPHADSTFLTRAACNVWSYGSYVSPYCPNLDG